jgi:hypothetical protein
LEPPIARQHVDEVPLLETAHQREDLVRRQVERVQDQAEVGVLDEREEPVRAVASSFHDDQVGAAPHLRFDVDRASRTMVTAKPPRSSDSRAACHGAANASSVSWKRSTSRDTRGAASDSLRAAPPAM